MNQGRKFEYNQSQVRIDCIFLMFSGVVQCSLLSTYLKRMPFAFSYYKSARFFATNPVVLFSLIPIVAGHREMQYQVKTINANHNGSLVI